MARMRRFCPPGLPQHVIQRGNNRQVCFGSEDDLINWGQIQINWGQIHINTKKIEKLVYLLLIIVGSGLAMLSTIMAVCFEVMASQTYLLEATFCLGLGLVVRERHKGRFKS